MQDTYTLWVCVDCMYHHANGECGSCHADEGHDREPWSNVDYDETECFTPGLMWHQHVSDSCRFSDDDSCGCEKKDSSWESCYACGSSLDGERYAFTGWLKD